MPASSLMMPPARRPPVVLDGDLGRDGGNGDRLAEVVGAGAADAEDLATGEDVQAARCHWDWPLGSVTT